MDKFAKITAPAGEKLRQLQRIVQEIKSNDGGLMGKIKRITNKPPPSVPRRDYGPGPQDDENDEWSDEFASDYENPDDDREETYVDPNEDPDESYEPPPNEPEPRFTPSYKFTDRNGGYAEKDRNQQPPSTPSTRPLPNPKGNFGKSPSPIHQVNRMPVSSKPALPKPLPKPNAAIRHQPPSLMPQLIKKPIGRPHQQQDDEDYVVPGDEEDDNYIEPAASPEPSKRRPPVVNRGTKPGQPPMIMSSSHQEDPDLYEVPENEDKPSPPVREALPLPRKKSPPKQVPPVKIDEPDKRPDLPMKPTPSPLPRNGKSKPPLPKPTSGLLPRDVNSNIEKPPVVAERPRIPSSGSDLPPTPPSRQRPHETNRFGVKPGRHGSIVEQDAGVLNKEWYSASCDRKTAEEALLATSKDGSFLVRRSTGQDQKQPFTLVVFYKRRVYNIPVRYIESTQQYALGSEKSGEEKFNSVADMIENHQQTNLVLIDSQTSTKYLTKLKHAVKVS